MGLSIIIPTHDRRKNLTHLVHGILNIDFPFETEIIIVNDFENQLYFSDLPVVEIFNPEGGVAKSRNLGVSVSNHDHLLFIDDDMIVTEDAILWIKDSLSTTLKTALNVDWIYPGDLLARAQRSKFGRYLINNGHASLKGWMNKGEWKPDSIEEIDIIASAFLGLKKQDFLSVNGYNEHFPYAGFEDYDFARKLKQSGVQGLLNTRLQIFHNEEANIVAQNWLKRRYRNGFTNAIGCYKLNYQDKRLHYTRIKSLAFTTIFRFRHLYNCFLWLIPNIRTFDPLYTKLFNPLLGAYIFKGYHDGTKEATKSRV